mgnify:CR=1
MLGMDTLEPFSLSICWACGSNKARRGERYCWHCQTEGRDSPWINCTVCGDARKRTRPGQRDFTCKKHYRLTEGEA